MAGKNKPNKLNNLSNMAKVIVSLPKDSAVVDFLPIHRNVLRGLMLRNPDLTLSKILSIALEPFIYENVDAGCEIEIAIEINVRREKEPV